MEYINGYREEQSLLTKDGKEIQVRCLEVSENDAVLDAVSYTHLDVYKRQVAFHTPLWK